MAGGGRNKAPQTGRMAIWTVWSVPVKMGGKMATTLPERMSKKNSPLLKKRLLLRRTAHDQEFEL